MMQRGTGENSGGKQLPNRADVELEAEQILPNIDDIKAMKSSSHAEYHKKMIMHPQKYNLTSDNAYNFSIAEMTLSNFANGKVIDNLWTIHISKQKTTKNIGELIVNFSDDLLLMIKKYIKHFRPLLVRNDRWIVRQLNGNTSHQCSCSPCFKAICL